MPFENLVVAAYEEHSVDIVNIPVLPAAVEECVFWDCDLGTIEHRWLRSALGLTPEITCAHLIHVVPDIQVRGRFLHGELPTLSSEICSSQSKHPS